ncbi:S41 family peptidase [Luteipulveratus mongoliensis]|uniref:Tail specific protease domain-containing protein n=1 Tax=Luteipulveratus mongoliensis TaxID=571913 RepID=A0A0K1JFT1_9MICO|nr:S41 family peptidase [Luteipulveratus mongoliensis]AKU15577.1 hypothetical protein VV02_06415 [Luteipulveratus mongoliensis]
MTPALKTDLIADLERLVRDHYVLEADIDAIAAALYDDSSPLPDSRVDLAGELTRRLQITNNDRHMRVRHCPDGPLGDISGDAYEQRWEQEARTNSGGIEEVRRITDSSGLMKIAPYTSPVHLARPYVEAAFTLLGHVEHLVIDLREGHGGTPETIALICSYLLGREPVHLMDVLSRNEPPRHYWTSPMAGRLGDDVRIDVLTSATTFSGCEELAYNLQAVGRATLIGETTGGGAHPVGAFALAGDLEATIPVARARNAITGTNWEQVGVVPDVPCAATDALDVALARR